MALEVAHVQFRERSAAHETVEHRQVVAHDVADVSRLVVRVQTVCRFVQRDAIIPVLSVGVSRRFPVDLDVASVHVTSLSSAPIAAT